MPYSFNLVDKPWIPCVMDDGESREMSLADTLCLASQIREVRAESPLVTASLHRLLLAILHRCFGPRSQQDWVSIWTKGTWDGGKVRDYLELWRERFDLFATDRPFYQYPAMDEVRIESPVSRLRHEMASGNNATLFDHSLDDSTVPASAAEVARSLVMHQAFAVGGGKSPTGYTTHGPLVGGLVVLFGGDTLFQTLMLNLIQYSPEHDIPIPSLGDDKPAWEREEVIAPGVQRVLRGYLDLLTWQSRAIKLIPEGSEEAPVVSKLLYAQGEGLDLSQVLDPQIPMFKHEKYGLLRMRLDPLRVLWRDSTALLNLHSDAHKPPEACIWVSQLVGAFVLDVSHRYRLKVYGLASDRAKLIAWREEGFPLPLAYLKDPDLVTTLADELSLAETSERALRAALDVFWVHMLEADSGKAEPKSKPIKQEQDPPAIGDYWSRLEIPFLSLLERIPVTPDMARVEWQKGVSTAAWGALDTYLRGMETSARSLRAAAVARREMARRMALKARKEGSGDAIAAEG